MKEKSTKVVVKARCKKSSLIRVQLTEARGAPLGLPKYLKKGQKVSFEIDSINSSQSVRISELVKVGKNDYNSYS